MAVRTSPNSKASGLGDVETTPATAQLLPGRLAAARQLLGLQVLRDYCRRRAPGH